MCGIAGILSNQFEVGQQIQSMTDALAHRGPDAGNVYVSDNRRVALGHRRLSIIDLSAAANQPFFSADQRFVVIFNGEIYNYKHLRIRLENEDGIKFRTSSDTEVIAEGFARKGKAFISLLEGMFAIAIYDTVRDQLFLVRDRLGKKPLYYYHREGVLAFASEMKSLLKCKFVPRQTSPSAISNFLHLGYIPEPSTIYQDIFKFPAGSFGTFHMPTNELQIETFWSVKQELSETRQSDPKQFESLFEDAVAKRLIADVPVGTFLSGGTDSSLVTAVASKLFAGKIKTFSIGFENSLFDESSYAREVAKALGTDHTAHTLTEGDAVALLEDYLNHFDEPFADTSAIPTMLVSALARKEVKVALTGDGGDELFQGYGSYDWALRLGQFPLRYGAPVVGSLLRLVGTLPSSKSSRLLRIAHLFENSANIRSHIFSQEQYFFSQSELRQIFTSPSHYVPFEYDESWLKNFDLNDAEKQALFDIQFYLKDDLLVKVDRASMYHALECRSPLLDHRIVAYALNLPYEFKKKNGTSKWLLKEVLKKYIPDDLVYRKKWGFSVPLSRWLRGELQYLISDFLNKQVVDTVGIVQYSAVEKLLREFRSGKDYLYHRIWVLIVLHYWMMRNR